MPTLHITDTKGVLHTVQSPAGITVMQAIRNAGCDDLLALCGGCCSCGTCHVIVDPAQFAALPAILPDEDDLLEGIDPRTPTSRLSCQLTFTDALDGLRVTIAAEA